MRRALFVVLAISVLCCPVAARATGQDHVARAHRMYWLDLFCRSTVHPTADRRFGPSQVDMRKSAVRTDNANGSSTLRVTLTGDLGRANHINAFDCVWIDTNSNGTMDHGEHAMAYVAQRVDVQWAAHDLDKIVFDVRIPRAVTERVCDRAYRIEQTVDHRLDHSESRQASRSSSGHHARMRWAYSQKVCSDAAHDPPPAEVPEASAVSLMAISAAVTGSAAFGIAARRRSRRRS